MPKSISDHPSPPSTHDGVKALLLQEPWRGRLFSECWERYVVWYSQSHHNTIFPDFEPFAIGPGAICGAMKVTSRGAFLDVAKADDVTGHPMVSKDGEWSRQKRIFRLWFSDARELVPDASLHCEESRGPCPLEVVHILCESNKFLEFCHTRSVRHVRNAFQQKWRNSRAPRPRQPKGPDVCLKSHVHRRARGGGQ